MNEELDEDDDVEPVLAAAPLELLDAPLDELLPVLEDAELPLPLTDSPTDPSSAVTVPIRRQPEKRESSLKESSRAC